MKKERPLETRLPKERLEKTIKRKRLFTNISDIVQFITTASTLKFDFEMCEKKTGN